MSDKIEHLNMIQSVITRMANNSLQVKCWTLAIAAAAVVLTKSAVIIALVLPLLVFSYLDIKYLSLEKASSCRKSENYI